MSYLPVSSNDTLEHLALPGSPDTLCGKLAIATPPTTYSRGLEGGGPEDLPADSQHNYLACDICFTLSKQDSILKQTALLIEAGQECPHCDNGKDINGYPCWNCEGTGRLEGPYDQSAAATKEIEHLRTSDVLTPKPVQCPNCGDSVSSKFAMVDHIKSCPGAQLPAAPQKVATNWTRDGVAIENGFDITITTDQAARTPFLDYTRVAVSEQRECPDCNETHWLSKIASCTDCDGLKCTSCMETIGLGGFLGTCKKCAGADSDLVYESAYENAVHSDQDRFLAYSFGNEDEEIDPLFLPNDPE